MSTSFALMAWSYVVLTAAKVDVPPQITAASLKASIAKPQTSMSWELLVIVLYDGDSMSLNDSTDEQHTW